MENASKALIMGGSIIIAVLLISALAYLYSNFINYERDVQAEDTDEQVASFNMQYASFEKELYGLELLALVNKVVDYNEENARLGNGYDLMYVQFKISNNDGISSLYKRTYDLSNRSSLNSQAFHIEDLKNETLFKIKKFQFQKTDYNATGRVLRMIYKEI